MKNQILQIGKWYSFTAYSKRQKGIVFVEKEVKNRGDVLGFGINSKKEYRPTFIYIPCYKFKEATAEEIEEAKLLIEKQK